MREHLVAVEYEGVSTVEEPGQFAVRGAIVDIYDPSWERPVRLELLDDVVASIRSFDVESQRSVEVLESIRLLPATGVIVNEVTLDALAANLRDAGFETETVSRIKQEIEDHQFSHLLRRYAPAMGVDGSILDFFAREPLVFFKSISIVVVAARSRMVTWT